MDLILGAIAFLTLTFLAALVRNDAVPWTIAIGRTMVKLAVRLQPEEDRERCASGPEYEHLAAEVRAGERSVTRALTFGVSQLGSQLVRSLHRGGWRARIRTLGETGQMLLVIGTLLVGATSALVIPIWAWGVQDTALAVSGASLVVLGLASYVVLLRLDRRARMRRGATSRG